MLNRGRLARATRQTSAYVRHVLAQRSASANSPEALFEFAKQNIGIVQLPEEVLKFHAFVRDKSPRVICEIGTAAGGHFYMLSRSFPTVSTLIGVDLQVGNRRLLQRLAPAGVDVHLISGDSTSAPVINAVRRAVGDRGIDVLFIDGDHRYSGVRSDYLNYQGLVRDGGIVAFHDIVPDQMSRNGRKTDVWSGDVPQFWSRLKPSAKTIEFVANPDQDGYGIGVVIRSAAATPPDL